MNNASKFNAGFLIVIVAISFASFYIQWKRNAIDLTTNGEESKEKKFGFLCCFCNNDLSSNITALMVVTNWDKNEELQHEQLLFCHKECLKDYLLKQLND